MQEYIKADRLLHWLSQEITKVIRACLPQKNDDSHTNLAFDELGNRIAGQWINTKQGKLLLSLNLSPLQYVWIDASHVVLKTISIKERNISDIRSEIAESLAGFGLDADQYKKKLHYEIPAYDFIEKPIKSPSDVGVASWTHYRALANTTCMLLTDYLQTSAEIRIWPHHFDTGIYLVPNDRTGIGFGLAMEDAMVGTPYFYISGYPVDGTLNYSNLPHLEYGKWHTSQNWKGGILSLQELNSFDDKQRLPVLKLFLKQTLHWYLHQ